MDTTRMKPETSVPQSAQQRNGAVRSAEGQRSAAGRAPKSQESPKPETRREAAPRSGRTAVKERETPRKTRTAEPPKQPVRKKKPLSEEERKPQKSRTEEPKQKQTRTRKPEPEKKTERKPERKKVKTEEPSYTRGLDDSVSTKKRAYGNSKPKKKTAADYINDAVKRSGQRKAEKIKKRQEDMAKGVNKKPRPQQPLPTVIYTQPAAFNASRFLIQMITVCAVVVALVMGLSVFFKVENITVSGAEVYSTWAVREASGIEEGDNLLTFSHARAGAQIKANLPYVNTVRFGIKLPDTVNIIIEEANVVYAIKAQDGTWWLMNSNGRMVEQANNSVAAKYTQILGVTVTDPIANERGVATESAAVYETNEAGETVPVPVAVTGAQRLNTALEIVRALEDNDIVGDAASVDVTRIEDIILWYGTRYQVNLGSPSNLAYKVACMNDVILQMSEYQSGILDISFTIWPNQVGYTPFG